MKKTPIFIVFLLLISNIIYSQDYSDKKHINQINKEYTETLQLTADKSKEFKQILLKYNHQLKDAEQDKKLFNKILKEQTIAVFNLVSAEQYTQYKKLVLELESYKKFKF
ncbi:MAG: hypothetical protein QM478_06570 [Flavobacteriaceae bacterium]